MKRSDFQHVEQQLVFPPPEGTQVLKSEETTPLIFFLFVVFVFITSPHVHLNPFITQLLMMSTSLYHSVHSLTHTPPLSLSLSNIANYSPNLSFLYFRS